MTDSRSALGGLTVPTALMSLIHTDDGQPYQRFAPAKIAAAAELAELSIRGLVDLEGRDIVGARPTTDGPTWVRDLSTELAAAASRRRITVSSWMSRRSRAYTEQRDVAVTEGVLERDRARLFGLVPYRTHVADAGVRARVLDALTGPSFEDPRVAALATIVVSAKMAPVLGLDSAAEALVVEKADIPEAGTRSLAMGAALATVGYVVLTG